MRLHNKAAWCFADVAADLLTVALKLPSADRVSTVDMAMTYITLAPDTVRAARRPLSAEAARFLEDDQRRFKNVKLSDRGYGLVWVAVEAYLARAGWCSETRTADAKIPWSSRSDSEVNQFDGVIRSRCLPLIPFKKVEVVAQAVKPDNVRFDEIDRELNADRVVGIGYNDSFQFNSPQVIENSHGAVIAGRRWNAKLGTCDYFVRDDFNDRCNLVLKKLRPSCLPSGIWLSAHDLRASIFSLQMVRPSK